MTFSRHCSAALAAALIFSLAPSYAQVPSKELVELRETSNAFYRAGDYREAMRFAERAWPLVVRTYGADHEQTGIQAHSLGLIAEKLGDLAAAQRHYTETVRIREKAYGQESPSVAMALENLSTIMIKLGRMEAAEPLVRRALKIRQDVVGANNSFAATGHSSLGAVSLARKDWGAALASYREAIRLVMQQDTSDVMGRHWLDEQIKTQYRDIFTGLTAAAWGQRAQQGSDRASLLNETFVAGQQAWNAAAGSALAKMSVRLGQGDTDLGRRIKRAQDVSERILSLNTQLEKQLKDWDAVQRASPTYSALQEEFRAASIARSRDHAPAIKRQRELAEQLPALSQRCPPGQKKSGCESSDKQRDEIIKELNELSKATSAGSGEIMALHARMEAAERVLPGYDEFVRRRKTMQDDSERFQNEVRTASQQITQQYPEYNELMSPKPLPAGEIQRLLKDDEALVVFLTGASKSYVWAVTRENAAWAEIDAGAKTLADHVLALRSGLDPLAQQDAEGAGGNQAGVVKRFDLDRAHALYQLVLAPVASTFSGKRHLILVPHGPLTSLPLQVLVTAPPARPGEAALREAAWLIRNHALSVLPSVQSLGALRKLEPKDQASKPFFGMGDPVLEGPDPAERERGGHKRSVKKPASYFRNGLADIRAVRELTPLPDTADELRAIAKVLGASPDSINLREAATETRVKSAPLSDYRIIQFATHGLVAGDLSGLTEPALVLTPPELPSDANDGLLTASEIATLKLNADWVVLSACNTAAGDGSEGAEALSGLARAFFYAGARALLVSHWAVYSTAATELTTKSFAILAKSPGLGRAEAYRQSMLAVINEGKPPAYWAPFVVVGEGGAGRR